MRKTSPEEKAAKRQIWYLANRDRLIAKAKKWKEKNRGKVLDGMARYRVKAAARIAEYNKRYSQQRQKEVSKIYYERRKEELKQKAREYYSATKKAQKAQREMYRLQNRGAIRIKQREYLKSRLANDLEFKLKALCNGRMRHALKGINKSARTMELIGCDGPALRAHIESQFKEGMSWANRSEWHIDHIVPLASFDLMLPEEQRMAFHYTNLQPLWAKENRQKAAKLDWKESVS